MLRALVRVLFGFLIACLIAGVVQVLFVVTPASLAAQSDKFQGASILALMAATQSAVFAAPFAFLVTAFAEWQAIRNWVFYAIAAIIIAFAGFLVQYSGETGKITILNDYAFKAFLTTGFVAGFVYWLVAGRNAGGEPPKPAAAPIEAA